MESILQEWEAFALSLLSASEHTSSLALRDHASQILEAVALDLSLPQTAHEQAEKSMGRAPRIVGAPETAAQTHAVLRAKQGFDIKQLAAEYRALRPSVLRLWTARCLPDAINPEDVMRFNEAIDQTLAESIEVFSDQVDLNRNLLFATLSHELRTPLNAILGWASLLRISKSHGEELDRGLATIERNAEAQAKIIDDLLDTSRIISGKVRLDVETVDLSRLLSDAVENVRTVAEAKGIRLQSDICVPAVMVSGDPNRLQQVFWNLLSNAIKFTPTEGTVRLVQKLVSSHIEITVADTGEGIDPAFLPYVFERFQQADGSTTRRHSGLGLGLAIVKQLVSLHGGSVCARSDGAGKGSLFVVTLPLLGILPHPEKEDGHPISETATPEAGAEAFLAGAKVLVVDDERDARELVQRLLELAGAEAQTVESASEALLAIGTWHPHVLISDIGMPEVDGCSLIKRVRSLYPDLPAIALTAYASAEDKTRAIGAGFNNHLAKPVDSAELLAIVARLAS